MSRHAFSFKLSALHLFIAASSALAMPPTNVDFCSVPAADTPVDTRTYKVSNVCRTVNMLNQVLSETKVADAPRRVIAAISPATIVYTDPDTGATLGTSRFIGATLFGFGRFRQYKAGDGVFDLVSGDASIIRVTKRQDGNHDVQPIDEERDDDDAVGLTFKKPGRRIWDTTPTSMFPMNGQPSPGGSSGGENGGASGKTGGSSLLPMHQPSGGAASGGAISPQQPQPQQPLTAAQKQLILSDLDIQISNLKAQLKQLQCDRLDAERNLDRAIALNVGVVIAQARVTQIIQQINNTQFRLTMLEQQRMKLKSQP